MHDCHQPELLFLLIFKEKVFAVSSFQMLYVRHHFFNSKHLEKMVRKDHCEVLGCGLQAYSRIQPSYWSFRRPRTGQCLMNDYPCRDFMCTTEEERWNINTVDRNTLALSGIYLKHISHNPHNVSCACPTKMNGAKTLHISTDFDGSQSKWVVSLGFIYCKPTMWGIPNHGRSR